MNTCPKCNRRAGYGTIHRGDGPCWLHDGPENSGYAVALAERGARRVHLTPHGETVGHLTGQRICAYCLDDWPCRTTRLLGLAGLLAPG